MTNKDINYYPSFKGNYEIASSTMSTKVLLKGSSAAHFPQVDIIL